MRLLYKSVLVLIAAFGVAAPAHAGTARASMAVSITVRDMCAIATTPVAASTGADVTGQINLQCTQGTAYSVGLSGGNTNLYQDAAHSVAWGNIVGSDTVNGTYAMGQQPLIVNGRIGQSASDAITVTVTY